MKKIPTLLIAASLLASVTTWATDQTNADNTGKNERDASGETKTPFDQSEAPADIELTANIRKMIIKDESLSMLAKNVKVITSDRAVVLRGPVETQKEKDTIAAHAKMAGAANITNQLEVK